MSLTSITVPPTVSTIEEYAFYGCTKLTNISIHPNTTIKPVAFGNCPNLDNQSLQRLHDHFTNSNSINIKVSETFKEGDGPMHGFLGKMQKRHGPEMWPITVDQIKQLQKHPLIDPFSTTMRDVVKCVIIRMTKGKRVGYALLINQAKPLKVKVMISVSTTTLQCSFTIFNSTSNIHLHHPSSITYL